MKPMLLGLIGVVVAILLMLRVGNWGTVSGFQDVGKTNERGTFTMYYADWCPHCQTAKPLFKSFMESGEKNIKGHLIKLDMIEEKQIKSMPNPPPVKGYPTFLYSDAAGKIVEFNGPRTADGFMNFLENVVLAK
jgi:thiol-disulfide isomerase/thioredoxin